MNNSWIKNFSVFCMDFSISQQILFPMRIIMFYSLLFLMSSCAATEQLQGYERANICSFLDNGKEIKWEQLMDPSKLNLKPTVRQTKLPTKFSVYQANEGDLKHFLQKVNQGAEPVIMFIPVKDQCIAFKVVPSGTMSKELAAKFPDVVSLKGSSVGSELVSIRIDYKEDNLKMEINDHGQIYLMETWPGKDGNYFLLFNKEDAGYEKTPNKPY